MGLFPDRFHQLAMYVDNPEFAVNEMMKLGYQEWIHDEAMLKGEVHGEKFETRGNMWFNYEFYGDSGDQAEITTQDDKHFIKRRRPSELEFLHYFGGSWHSAAGRTDENGFVLGDPFISHMSCYVQNAESEVMRLEKDHGIQVIQWFETSEHINKYLKQRKQTFYEFIFDTRLIFGYDLKIIQRVFH